MCILLFHSGNTDLRSNKVLKVLTLLLGRIGESFKISEPTADFYKFALPYSDPKLLCYIKKGNKQLPWIMKQATIFKGLCDKGVSIQIACRYVLPLEVNVSICLMHPCVAMAAMVWT